MQASDPFASTSKALGRAAERRGQRNRRDENAGTPRSSKTNSMMASTSSFDSSSQPPPIPSRNTKGGGFPDVASPSSNSSPYNNKSRSHTRSSGSGSRSREQQFPSSSPLVEGKQLRGGGGGEKSILDVLPPEYRYNPKNAAPVLYHLQKTLEGKNTNGESKVDVSLETLLNAADNDVRLHRARVKAGIEQGELFV